MPKVVKTYNHKHNAWNLMIVHVLVCVVHGMALRHKMEKVWKTHKHWLNMINMISQDKVQALELTWVQFNTKMSLGHFVKHLTCNEVHIWWKMHEHNEVCLNTCSNCHMGPTQIHKHQMGLSPIKKFWKFFHKYEEPQPTFWKSPLFKTLS